MAFISKDQVRQIILDRPDQSQNPSVIIQALRDQGHKLEGFDEAQTQAPPKGFWANALDYIGETASRFGSSVASVPERTLRGFGSDETRQGRQETSTGFDLADLPGDIADIIGPALPVFGGIVGGAAAVPAAVTGPGAFVAGGAGAGLAGGAMEGGRRMIGDFFGVDEKYTGERADFSATGEVAKGIATEGALNAVGELGGRMVVGGLKSLAAPFAKQFMGDVAEIATRNNIKLPVSAMTTSNVARTGEAIASKGFFGGSVGEISEKASKDISRLADDFVQSIGGADDLLLAGKSIDDGAKTYREAWQSVKGKLYKKAGELISARPKREYIDVSEPIGVLERLLGSKGAASELLGDEVKSGRLQTILQNLKSKKLSIGILESTTNELGQMINQGGLVKVGDEAALASVKSSLQEAMEKHITTYAPDVAKALNKADAAYQKGIQLLDSGVGNQIDSLAETPERIVEAIIKPNSESNTKRLLELVGRGKQGPQRVANVKTAFAKRLLEGAKNQDGVFAGDKLGDAIKKYGKTIPALFGDDVAKQLDEIAKLSHAMHAGQKIASGSQTAFITKIGSVLSAASAALLSGRPDLSIGVLLGAAGGDFAITKLFATDAGRKLLLDGYKMQMGRAIPSGAQGLVQGVRSFVDPTPSTPNDANP